MIYPYPIVKVTYKGKPLGREEYEKRPEIHKMYPSREEFMQKLYLPLVKQVRETGKSQLLEISENGIKINGLPFELL